MWVVTQTSLRRQSAGVTRYLALGVFGRPNRFQRTEQKEEGAGKGAFSSAKESPHLWLLEGVGLRVCCSCEGLKGGFMAFGGGA